VEPLDVEIGGFEALSRVFFGQKSWRKYGWNG